MKVHIAIGLPGSGKSTFLDNIVHTSGASILLESYLGGDLERELRDAIEEVDGSLVEEFAVDLLFINKSSLHRFMVRLENFLGVYNVKPEYSFYVFNPNLYYSIVNDYTRNRDKRAEKTIRHMFNNWDFELSELPGEVWVMNSHKPNFVQEKIYESRIRSYYINTNEIVSESWATGVSYCSDEENYYSNEEPVDKYSNKPLYEFLKFLGDDNIDELRKDIIDELAYIDTFFDTDDYYYSADIHRYVIQTSDLISLLKRKSLI